MGVVYYELLKAGETVNAKSIKSVINNWIILTVPCLKKGHNTERDNTKSFFFMTVLYHMCQKLVWDTLETLSWEVPSHEAYSPDLTPSDYHLFTYMGHALVKQRFGSYEDVKKWLDE